MAVIRITDLKLRTIIGTNDWERDTKQDVVINITIDFDALKASKSDNIEDTVDYKALTKKIIQEVENSSFFLLEKLCNMALQIIMQHPFVNKATVRIDKPHAIRFAETVSVELSDKRSNE